MMWNRETIRHASVQLRWRRGFLSDGSAIVAALGMGRNGAVTTILAPVIVALLSRFG
jgi:hypothetical protein